jgi:hypothetical protein
MYVRKASCEIHLAAGTQDLSIYLHTCSRIREEMEDLPPTFTL